jgi:hypothetical protein
MSHVAPSRRRPVVAGLLLIIGLLAVPHARAADKLGNSLDLVPADASFYSASLRLKEQLDILLGSKAWSRLTEMPSVKMGLAMAKAQMEQPGGPKEQWDRFMQDPHNQRLLELLADMGSHEMFVYGDKRFADSLGLTIEAINAARYAPMFYKLTDPGGGANDEQIAVMALLETLNENLDRLVVPDLVFGFKITDTSKADLQLLRLETLVNVVVQLLTINEFKDRFGRVRVGDTDFLELRLDGKLVPWEEMPFDDFEENPGDFEPLKKHLRTLKMTINIGVKDGYLLFSIGDTNEHLVSLGKGDLLVNRPEMRKIKEHLSKRVVGIGYTSKEFNSLITGTKEDIDGFVELAEELLPHADLETAVEKRIIEDVEALAKDIKQFVPEPGASVSCSFLTPRGYESYSYDWTQNLSMDDSKRLTLLDHAGGTPLLAAVTRSKYNPKDYDLLVKWLKKAYAYAEEFALPQAPPEEQEKFRQGMQFALPLLKRIDQATRNDLIPALADGQAGIVIDADIASKRWHRDMPEFDKPLPMLEVALVFGVSDADKLKKAFREYQAVAQTVVEQIQVWHPESIPAGYRVPDPKSRETSGGQLFWYEIPADAGFDSQVQPAAGVSKTVAVISTSARQAERMLSPATLQTRSKLISERATAGSAVHFDFAGLIDAVQPWAEGAMAHYLSARGGGDDAAAALKRAAEHPQFKDYFEQIRTGAEILKCYRGTTSVSYLEDGATVSHSESVFEDLK